MCIFLLSFDTSSFWKHDKYDQKDRIHFFDQIVQQVVILRSQKIKSCYNRLQNLPMNTDSRKHKYFLNGCIFNPSVPISSNTRTSADDRSLPEIFQVKMGKETSAWQQLSLRRAHHLLTSVFLMTIKCLEQMLCVML